MVKRNYSMPNEEPDQTVFEKPSEKEHLFQVVDVFDTDNHPQGFDVPDNIVFVKLEVVGGEEEGRALLHRLTLDIKHKGFFATRLFLKALGQEYKGDVVIDTDNWVGYELYATVIHNGKYANISDYNFDKKPANKAEKGWDDELSPV